MQSYEGYFKNGRFYTAGRIINIPEQRRVIIVILDEPINEKPDTWAGLDEVVSEMDVKPRLEELPDSKGR